MRHKLSCSCSNCHLHSPRPSHIVLSVVVVVTMVGWMYSGAKHLAWYVFVCNVLSETNFQTNTLNTAYNTFRILVTWFQRIADVAAAGYGIEPVVAAIAGLTIFSHSSGGNIFVHSTAAFKALDCAKIILFAMRMGIARSVQLCGIRFGRLGCMTHIHIA